MRFQGSIIKEQGVTFAIVVVKKAVINNVNQANKTAQSFSSIFPNMPIVLMAQDNRGIPTYRGRRDIVKFLSKVPISAIPWRKYSI